MMRIKERRVVATQPLDTIKASYMSVTIYINKGEHYEKKII